MGYSSKGREKGSTGMAPGGHPEGILQTSSQGPSVGGLGWRPPGPHLTPASFYLQTTPQEIP